jgi:outer membrane protein assembly factor BamB
MKRTLRGAKWLGLILVASASCHDTGAGPDPIPPAPGQVLWRNSTIQGTGRPGVDTAKVYAITADQVVYALDKQTGDIVWRHQVPPSNDLPGADVLALGSRVLVDAKDLYGLDAATGDIIWKFQPSVGAATGFYLIGENAGHAYVGARIGRGYLYSLNVLTGAQEWVVSIFADDSTRVFDPIVEDGVVYARFTVWRANGVYLGGAAAVDAATGRLLWSKQLPPAANPLTPMRAWSIAVGPAVVIVSGEDGHVFALDRATGGVVWTVPPYVSPPGATIPSPDQDIRAVAISGTTVVIGSNTGFVTAVRVNDGTKVWQATANRGSTGLLLAADGSDVYVLHAGGQLAAFDVATGTEPWLVDAGFVVGPRLDGDRLYGSGPKGVAAIAIH